MENKGSFNHFLTISSDGFIKIKNDSLTYQVQATSRLSFVGCWLDIELATDNINPINKTKSKVLTELFIYKDSLSEQDYARLVSVINSLANK